MLRLVLLLTTGLVAIVTPMCSQTAELETPGGADRHETTAQGRDHFFGDWGGMRSRLEEIGVGGMSGQEGEKSRRSERKDTHGVTSKG